MDLKTLEIVLQQSCKEFEGEDNIGLGDDDDDEWREEIFEKEGNRDAEEDDGVLICVNPSIYTN